MVRAFQELGERVQHVQDAIRKGAPDDEVLRHAAKWDYRIISLDRKIRSRPHEKVVYMEAGVGIYFLKADRKKKTDGWEIVTLLIKHWAAIKADAEKQTTPFMRLVVRNGPRILNTGGIRAPTSAPPVLPQRGSMCTPLRPRPLVVCVLFVLLTADVAAAQIGGALRRVAERASDKVDVSKLFDGDPPITTSLTDAVFADESRDGFTPESPARPLTELERTRAGGFVLQPGFFEMHTQSYCLKAGTHGPGGGDGYLFAPTKGPAEEFVIDIVRSSVLHPDIAQRDIQVLLWAIIARSQFEDLPTPLKVTASKLMNARQLALLNRNALDLLPGPALDQALERVPPLARQVLQAEAQLRQMLVDPASSFEQLEAVAVLAGMAGIGEGSREVPAGRWSRHPDGYYVRYMPRGYSYTVVQIWVPEDSPAVGESYDPALHIAVPGNTSRQRLIQSGRARATQ